MRNLDMYGKEVRNGDYLVEGHEEYCYIFKVRDNKPVVLAKECLVNQNLVKMPAESFEEATERIRSRVDHGELPDFFIGLYERELERMKNPITKDLMRIEDNSRSKIIWDKFLAEDNDEIEVIHSIDEHTYESVVIAKFPDGELVLTKN
jgi:hypothetical protein